jgi:hypothetical protein
VRAQVRAGWLRAAQVNGQGRAVQVGGAGLADARRSWLRGGRARAQPLTERSVLSTTDAPACLASVTGMESTRCNVFASSALPLLPATSAAAGSSALASSTFAAREAAREPCTPRAGARSASRCQNASDPRQAPEAAPTRGIVVRLRCGYADAAAPGGRRGVQVGLARETGACVLGSPGALPCTQEARVFELITACYLRARVVRGRGGDVRWWCDVVRGPVAGCSSGIVEQFASIIS